MLQPRPFHFKSGGFQTVSFPGKFPMFSSRGLECLLDLICLCSLAGASIDENKSAKTDAAELFEAVLEEREAIT